jgi:hypothetical protein
MRRFLLLGLVFAAAPAVAQLPRRQALEQQIVTRFLENYRQQAGLTADQYARFRTVATRAFTQRRERQTKERALWAALEGQMRPGVAASPDSVSRLLDAIVASRLAGVEQFKADDREFAAFLSAVQRAQLFLAMERLQRNVEDLIRRRFQQGGVPGDVPEP